MKLAHSVNGIKLELERVAQAHNLSPIILQLVKEELADRRDI